MRSPVTLRTVLICCEWQLRDVEVCAPPDGCGIDRLHTPLKILLVGRRAEGDVTEQ